jgi:hypothetical protein
MTTASRQQVNNIRARCSWASARALSWRFRNSTKLALELNVMPIQRPHRLAGYSPSGLNVGMTEITIAAPLGKEKPASSGSERAGFVPCPFVGKGRRENGGLIMPTQ